MARETERDDASKMSTDRETIRQWADEIGGTPYRHVDEERFRVVTDDDAGESHERIGWDEFFDHLDAGDQVVIYHGERADEPLEVTTREEAFARSERDREEFEDRLMEGETVTTTVTETTVVEEVIVEEATIESELIETEIVDDRVVDVELIRRECSECSLEDTGSMAEADWFDRDRYVETVGSPGQAHSAESTESETMTFDVDEFPFTARLDVEEAWSVTREFTERFTVESRVADVDVVETDTVEDRDVDVEGLQQSLVESDLLEMNLSPDEILTEYEVETQFHEDDRIRTHFTRSRVVEDEVVDRQRLRADVTEAELLEFERIETRDVETEMTDEERATTGTTDEVVAADTEPTDDSSMAHLSEDEIGKDVVDASGEKVGMVTDVADDGTTMYVDAHPGITERIKAALDWGGAAVDDYPVGLEQISSVTRDAVRLKEADEIEEASAA